jgi:hypothetical protein
MDFWALILGLMATIFGGIAFCYGLVMLGEKVVQKIRASVPCQSLSHARYVPVEAWLVGKKPS